MNEISTSYYTKGFIMNKFLGVLFSIIFLGLSAQADTVLGSTLLDRDGFDMDTVVLNPMQCDIRAVQMQITQRSAKIRSFSVQYDDGRWDMLDVMEEFNRGETSRWYGLRDGANCIKKISIVGDSGGMPFKKALVTFVGR
jgi:hypothetical protein